MNILLIPNNDWINHPVPAQRHYRIFEALGQTHNVYVLYFDIFHKSGKPTHNPVSTHLVKPFTIHIPDAIGFYALNFPFQLAKVFKILRELSIDLVFGSHLAICTVSFVLSKLDNIKTVFDLSDFFPASAVSYYGRTNNYATKALYFSALYLMSQNIRLADLCTACSDALVKYAKSVSPYTRVHRMPNGVDTQLFLPKKASPKLRDELCLRENTLIYVGSIESWLDFEPVIKGVALLKGEGIYVDILVVGRNIYPKNTIEPILQKIREHGLEKQIKFVGYWPYERLPEFINLSIAGLIPFKTDSFLTSMAFPNKLLEYLACGKPVLAPPLPELTRVGGKYVFCYRTPKEFVTQVKRILGSDADPTNAREVALKYDWNKIATRLDETLQQLASK